eukprot:TRINITY_DN26039_c0_g1_i1.p1 TRINITY_DN26039_c0_g1~~TRINITY_DN26039_c0_g1_i1.p1  ORF type:complete len:543 (+),score=209.07 TRINITY_DN26039_c0_g1_i1:74-1702(+)
MQCREFFGVLSSILLLLHGLCLQVNATKLRASSLQSLASELTSEDEQSSVLDELSSERDDARGALGDDSDDAVQLAAELADGDSVDKGDAPTAGAEDVAPPKPAGPRAAAAAATANSAAIVGGPHFEERLSAAESENAQLRQLLAQADNYENELWAKFKAYKEDAANAAAKVMGRSRAVPKLHHEVRELEGQVKGGLKKLADQRKFAKLIKLKLLNVTRSSGQHQRAMGWAQLHLASLQRQNTAMYSLLKNATATDKQLAGQLDELHKEGDKTQGEIKAATEKLREKVASEKHLEEEKEEALAATSQWEEKANAAEKRLESEEISAKAVFSQIDPIKKEVKDEDVAINQEAKSMKQWQQKGVALSKLLQQERFNTSRADKKLRQFTAAEGALKQKVEALKKDAESEDDARYKVEAATKKVLADKQRAEAEVKNLRGSGPALEAQVAAAEEKVQKEAVEEKKAFKERDQAKSELAVVQEQISQLEKRYTSTVAVLGKTEGRTNSVESVVAVNTLTAVADDSLPAVSGDYDDHDLEDKFDSLVA